MRKARTQALTIGTVFLAAVLPIVFVVASPAGANELDNVAVTLTNSSVTASSEAVTVSSTSALSVGMSVADSTTPSNIPSGTTVAAINSSTTLTLSQDAKGTSTTDTLVFGDVALDTTGTVTSGTPYSSGQVITVSVAPNSTLAGDSSFSVWECADPDGTTANLPTTGTNNCDGHTTIASTDINSDGSIPAFDYTLYALPDSATFHEKSSSLPVCGVYPNDCVLYIGASTSFTAGTYLFSAPFQVESYGNDSGSSPGDGTPEVPLAIALPLFAIAVGGGTLFLRRRRRAHAA